MLRRRKALLVALAYTLVLCGVVHYFVNPVQPTAYMDEVFHEEQTISYLHGEWQKWNPKITTPPGLYVLTTFLWKVLPFRACVENFRFLNCFIGGANFILLAELTQSILSALTISTLPVLFFTAILFYTDQLSLLALLLTLHAQRSSLSSLALLFGCFACFVRQTNVVWLAFMIGQEAIQRLARTQSCARKTALQWCIYLIKHPGHIVTSCFKAALLDAPHHTATIVLFATFVIVFNQGDIVLGDRSAHKPTLHVPQIFYLFVFCALHTPTAFLRYLYTTLYVPRRLSLITSIWITLLLFLTVVVIDRFTVEHPYLLADNRHYTFYLWSRLFRRYKSFRYTLAPVYIICGDYVCRGLRGGSVSEFLTSLGYLVAIALVLVPAGLLEPRYFIAPYVVWRLTRPRIREERSYPVVEVAMNAFINAVTVHIFAFYPFRWLSQPFTWQRFMW
ncbi:Alpha-1,2-glucosyltransferase ALG10-A [Echinococcus granulosus]|uniref:Dol-P-Glc:Glc(2)Man(9)GlcNAc(2)-PP-Dol alpha-1,2-glucosyltransferase n=1 Tax=Echinococcus granulosus TaxID=6210 RepID=W6UB02_ECHGR|nr:Alpha-1,2-glucosyltransferase ALG10-A [Echinococcus granulosus]EUB58270.1 Alpha-1,2-glucosyltransferase ALG10-A [Echinococcus granulosus]